MPNVKAPRFVRVAARPETLPPVGDAEVLPPTTQLVAVLPGGISKRMTLMATAALLVGAGYTVTAPAASGGGSTPATAPGQVTGLALVGQVYNGAAQLIWSATPTSTSYRVERRALGTSSYVIVIASTSTASASVSGLPFETTQEIRVTASNSAGSGAPSAPLSVVVPAYVAPVAGALAISFRIKAVAAMPAGSPISWFQPFAAGDVLAGTRVTLATAAGSVVAVQQDQENFWPAVMAVASQRGSLRGAALSFLTPAALAEGQIAEFRIGVVSGAPDRTGHTTLEALRSSSDIYLKLFGLDLGADTMLCSFNQITGDFAQADANDSWGVNPVGGWEVIRSGPLCVEYRGWRFTNKLGDGGRTHKWQKGQIYLRQWSNGQREILPVVTQPNAYQAHLTGTIGADVQGRLACYAELWDGGTRLHTYAGPDAPNAFTVPASAFGGTEANRLSLPAGTDARNYWDRACAVGFSGALPSSFSADKAYFPYVYDGRATSDFNMTRDLRGDYAPMGTAASSGTARCMPVMLTYPAGGAVLVDEHGHSVWQGGAGRPRYLPALDEFYLTRKTTLLPEYDLTVERPDAPATSGERWLLGSSTDELMNNDKGSDDWRIDRIGWLPRTSANLVVLPFNGQMDFHCRRLALQYSNYTIWLEDHRSGREVVSDNGPNDDGVTYPGFGPVNPTLGLHRSNGPSGNPGWGGSSAWNPGGGDVNYSGYDLVYGVPSDVSHQPDYLTMAYVRTGHHVYAAMTAAISSFMHAQWTGRTWTTNGKTYYSALFNNHSRNQAWTLRTMGNSEAVLPDRHPYRKVLKHHLDSWAAFVKAEIPNSGVDHLGLNIGGQESSPWQQAINLFTIGQEVHRNTRPDWQFALLTYAKFLVRAFDDQGEVPNGGCATNWYSRIRPNNAVVPPRDGATWPTIAAMMTQASYFRPFQATGFYPDNSPTREESGRDPLVEASYDTPVAYTRMHMAALAKLKTLNDAGIVSSVDTQNAGRVRQQHLNRINAYSYNDMKRAPILPGNVDSAVMTWAVVSA